MVYSPCRDKLYLLDSNLTVTGDVLSWQSDPDRLTACDESFTEEDEVSGCGFKAEWEACKKDDGGEVKVQLQVSLAMGEVWNNLMPLFLKLNLHLRDS